LPRAGGGGGGGTYGLTRTIALVGPTRFLYVVKEEREFLLAAFEMIHEWDSKRLEALLDVGVDIVYCSGCYECTELLSPRSILELFFPFHWKMVNMIDQAGAKFHHYTITGIMPLLADYQEMGFHILSSLDRMDSSGELRVKAVDLEVAKREIGDRVRLWAGSIQSGQSRWARERTSGRQCGTRLRPARRAAGSCSRWRATSGGRTRARGVCWAICLPSSRQATISGSTRSARSSGVGRTWQHGPSEIGLV
jgi:hypothetical protein